MGVEMPSPANNQLLGNVLSLMQDVTPRDMDTLRTLKQQHLMLLEVKITAVAAALGMHPHELPLPPKTVIMTVVRGDSAMTPEQFELLQEGDVVILMASVRHESYIRQVLCSPNPICLLD